MQVNALETLLGSFGKDDDATATATTTRTEKKQ